MTLLKAAMMGVGPRRAGFETLPFNPVLWIHGDSQSKGTATAGEIAAFKASYVVTNKVKILNFAGAFVDYDPNNNMAGYDIYSGNTGNGGFEAGYIEKFRVRFPNNTLYIIKQAAPGSFMSKNPTNIGTITGSISGNILTVTAGTGVSGAILTGTGVPIGTYIMFTAGGNTWYVGKPGTTTNLNLTVASTSMTQHNAFGSWSNDYGLLYQGSNASITNQSKGKTLAALALITTPRIVTVLNVLGTNDMSSSISGATFQAEQAAYFTKIATDFDLSNAQIVMPRVGTGGSDSTTVRAAQAVNKAAAPTRRKLIDMDSYTRHDSTHWNMAGLTAAGREAFDVSFGISGGL